MQNSILSTPSANQLSSIYTDAPIQMMHSFTKYPTYETADSVVLAFNNTHIFLYENLNSNNPKYCIPFCFSLKFQILRDQWPDELTPGKPIGITFQKDGHHPLTFYSNSPLVVQTWRIKLEEKINQRGFHKLFKARRKIGKGAFATVYLAERLIDKKLVAVKAFSKEKQYSGDKGKDSLINELTLMRKLKNHANIINLEGVFETENSIYVILQNLDGGQLHQRIKTGYKFKNPEIMQIMQGILKGLAYMDSHRIIHRDLKPENMLFKNKYSSEIVIADFGLATWAEQPTYLFVRCGTPGFVAPQIINIKDMSTHSDPISDVFSAGLIFHYLLLGKSVFKGSKYAQILAQNRACDFKLSGQQYDCLDRKAYDLLTRMLDVNPQTRIRAHQALKHKLFNDYMQVQPQQQKSEKGLSRQVSMTSASSCSYQNSLQSNRAPNNVYDIGLNQLNNVMRKANNNKQNERMLIMTPRSSHRRSDANNVIQKNPLNSPSTSPRQFTKKRQNIILSTNSSYMNSNANSIHFSSHNPKQQFDRNA